MYHSRELSNTTYVVSNVYIRKVVYKTLWFSVSFRYYQWLPDITGMPEKHQQTPMPLAGQTWPTTILPGWSKVKKRQLYAFDTKKQVCTCVTFTITKYHSSLTAHNLQCLFFMFIWTSKWLTYMYVVCEDSCQLKQGTWAVTFLKDKSIYKALFFFF